MPDTAIQIDHLSKMYRLGVINNGALFQDIQSWIALKRGKEDPHSKIGENKYKGDKDHFWALKDISFDIKQGDRIGIIGKNGAGKSTLLKILSRITIPTEGTIKINGRVASLLEVGTGFHQELTGRENIYLNGAILGMKKRRIDEKLDSIIEFSGIEHHIDTPVKRYSSGMYVRLAFAVAAHLDSDILIADEVLAVGDAEFQKKALGKMQDLSTGEGRTVLFVSHNMNSIELLCKKGILLEQGNIKIFSDNIHEVIKAYFPTNNISSIWKNNNNLFQNSYFIPNDFFIGDINANILSMPIHKDNDFYVHIIGEIKTLDPCLQIGYAIYDEKNNLLFWSNHNDNVEEYCSELRLGHNHIYSKIPKYFLNEGNYRIEMIVSLFCREWICEPNKYSPYIHLEIGSGLKKSSFFATKRPGILSPVMKWYNQ